MKLNDIFRDNGGYVVALIESRDSDETPRDIKPKLSCMTFDEAVREREKLADMDIIICPPFRQRDISPAETADYFRSYFGMNND